MDIDGDDPDQHRARLAWMINEFEEARRRRLVKPGAAVVESDTTAGTTETPATPATPRS